MAPTFQQIQGHVEKIRNYIFGDLTRITQQKQGNNYAAVAIMMCACDLFSRLRYGKDDAGAMFVTNYMGKANGDVLNFL